MLLGGAAGDPAALGLDAAFPAGLIALILPSLRDRDTRLVALTGAAVAVLLTPVLPAGLPVLLRAARPGRAVPPAPPKPAPPTRRRAAAGAGRPPIAAAGRRGRAGRATATGTPAPEGVRMLIAAILALAVGTYAIRLAGVRPARPAGPAPTPLQRLLPMAAAALLAALAARRR